MENPEEDENEEEIPKIKKTNYNIRKKKIKK